MILGVLAGLCLAIAGLIPGVPATTLVLLLLPLLHGDSALTAAGIAVGCGGVLSVLHAAYHPVADRMLAHADIASQLSYEGRGRAVIWVHALASVQAYYVVLLLGLGGALFTLCGVPIVQLLIGVLKHLSGLILLWVCWRVLKGSKRPWRTLLAMMLAGVMGFVTFHLPALTGNEWGMTALLGGLFSLPAGWGLVTTGTTQALPDQQPLGDTRALDPDGIEVTGTLLGIFTGFLAGVGTGSLVSAWRSDDEPWKYLAIASAADMANNVWALLALVLAGSTRSGAAVAVAEAGAGIDAWSALILLAAVGLGVFVGVQTLQRLQDPYRKILSVLPQHKLGWVLVVGTTLLVLGNAGMTGLGVMLGAWLVSSLAKSWRVPNQALMLALIGPVLLDSLSLTAGLAGWLGL